ncbi:hypothetical protein B296_00011605 [Ensete ventricosum]|uniref:Uncharacterized protein n=1 Tax=Ensete ventricosum TaxID=4639 RepID=A0A427AR58_ENSVE|nr:hypothetical protein B296_00011605 [Ensete ventricosum]
MLPTPNRYWRLFNDPGLAPPDPGLSPITPGLGTPVVTTKAPLSPTSLNWPRHRRTNIPMSPGRRCNKKHPSRGCPKENTPAEHPARAVEAAIENPNASVSQPPNRSRDVMRLPPKSNVVSSDSTNSMREQLR